MTCSCAECFTCAGTGVIWFAVTGKCLGKSRCDDLDEMEMCPDCNGDGVEVFCEDCANIDGC